MHVNEMNEGVQVFLLDAATLAAIKNRDYHPDGVAMLEILQTAFETGVTVEQDLWGRIRKQMSALRRFIIEGHVESEPPNSRMTDVAVYMAILNFWVANRKQCVDDALHFISSSRPCETYSPSMTVCPDCDRCNFLRWLSDYAHSISST